MHQLIKSSTLAFTTLLLTSSVSQGLQVSYPPPGLDVPITVKQVHRTPTQIGTDAAGLLNHAFPAQAVVPLPRGEYTSVSLFKLKDSAGEPVPAQFSVLSTWSSTDTSIRYLKVNFQPTVPYWDGQTGTYTGSGTTQYFLGYGPPAGLPLTPLDVDETSDPSRITVVTGPLKFTVRRDVGFNVVDELWLDLNEDGVFNPMIEQMITSNSQAGGRFQGYLSGDLQLDATRNDLRVDVLESGPMRALIRVSAPALYSGIDLPGQHLHGFSVYIYAYAGKPYLRVVYQLRNDPKYGTDGSTYMPYGFALHFDSMEVQSRLIPFMDPDVRVGMGDGSVLTIDAAAAGDGVGVEQTAHDAFDVVDDQGTVLASGSQPDGFLDVSDLKWGMTAYTRNFWQQWPNGLRYDLEGGESRVTFELWPEWSAQWYEGALHGSDEFWLDNGQNVHKELYWLFHGPDVADDDLVDFARTCSLYPVPTLPVSWHQEAGSLTRMRGLVPIDERIVTNDDRLPAYPSGAKADPTNANYSYGIPRWGVIEASRLKDSRQSGGSGTAAVTFMATENPAEYFEWLDWHVLDETVLRPQWKDDYDYDRDFSTLVLWSGAYADGEWGNFHSLGGYCDPQYFPACFLYGVRNDREARDMPHFWVTHALETYALSGDELLGDWVDFVEQFLRSAVKRTEPYPSSQPRAWGWTMNTANQVAQLTNDPVLEAEIVEYVRDYAIPTMRARNSAVPSRQTQQDGWFLHGAIAASEAPWNDPQLRAEFLQAFLGILEQNTWDYDPGAGVFLGLNFAYNKRAPNPNQSSSSGAPLLDPQAFGYHVTGIQKYLDHAADYVQGGINGGSGPASAPVVFGNKSTPLWTWAQYVLGPDYSRPDTTPPAAITDLRAIPFGSSVGLVWTTPTDTDLERFHVVWSDAPISPANTTDPTQTNWWDAEVVGPGLVPQPGQMQYVLVTPPNINDPFYAAVFTFDQAQNMSAISNVAQK